jgi:cobalt-zinc-cadmium efflux system membrane fusion protein
MTSPVPARTGAFRSLARATPGAIVLVGLAGAAYLGHATGWDFTGGKPVSAPATSGETGRPRAVVRFVPAGPDVGELPLPGRNARIEFDSTGDVDALRIDIAPVWTASLTEQVTAGGEIMFDPSRVARLSARAGGVTQKVFKAAGEPVAAGQAVAHIDSPEVGKAKGEFQQALVQSRLRERTRDDIVSAMNAASAAAVREAEAALKEAGVRVLAAAQALTNLGLPLDPSDFRRLTPSETAQKLRQLGVEGETARTDPAGPTANLLPVRAPFAGVVLSADVVAGEVVEGGKTLFVIVDPSRVWVTLHVGSEDARRVAVGQKVFFRPDGGSSEHPAAVIWVGTAADEATRTVPVRAQAENTSGSLRASTLGRGRIVFREEEEAVVVPHEAVQMLHGRPVVFVRDPDFLKPDGPKAFDVRAVKTGGRDERNTEILAGVSSGEIVATKNSGVLLTELNRALAGR